MYVDMTPFQPFNVTPSPTVSHQLVLELCELVNLCSDKACLYRYTCMNTCSNQLACTDSPKNKYFELKKLVGRRWGAPNSNYLLVMMSTFVMFSITLNARLTPGCTMQKYECIRVLNTNQEAVPKHPHTLESWQLHGKLH